MPELPEVEIIKNGILSIENKIIKNFYSSNKKLRVTTSIKYDKVLNAKIISIKRISKFIIIELVNSDKYYLICHLGMTGKITLKADFNALKHDHFALEFDDIWLIFNDQRRFGFVEIIKDLTTYKFIQGLGPEPLSEVFNYEYLKNKLKTISKNIKTSLMDNKLVVGVGNIYANESLFDAGISPLKPANKLKKEEIITLLNSVKKIIKNAIELGGSSIKDYVNSDGKKGGFQKTFKVYGKADIKCVNCDEKIVRIVQNQRSTFYCKTCQK